MTANIRSGETNSKATFLIDELIRERRTKRGFSNRPLPIETVEDILSIAEVCTKFKQHPALAVLRAIGQGSRTCGSGCGKGVHRYSRQALSGVPIFSRPAP
jgi:hypothetical protein